MHLNSNKYIQFFHQIIRRFSFLYFLEQLTYLDIVQDFICVRLFKVSSVLAKLSDISKNIKGRNCELIFSVCVQVHY